VNQPLTRLCLSVNLWNNNKESYRKRRDLQEIARLIEEFVFNGKRGSAAARRTGTEGLFRKY
jgi:hypothetical protein